MPETDIVDVLTGIFADANRAHREAFVDAGGADPEWPLWYAEHLVAKLNDALSAHMTRSELCYLLISADREMRSVAPGADWHGYYARFFADRYA